MFHLENIVNETKKILYKILYKILIISQSICIKNNIDDII